jgi:ribose/xylose/arabinose/galactoside ABC-type transport system permease subunit
MTLVVLGHGVLTRTTWGQMVVTTGGNKLAAEVAGIRTDRVKIACFVLTSLLAAVAGMLVMARIKTGATQIGDEWELDVITAVLVGGASLAGGIGTVLGSLIGMIFLQAVRSGLVIVGVSSYLQQAAVGLILLVAASLDLFRRGRRRQA